MLPEVLLFDVFGTVVDWRGSVAREVKQAAETRGAALDPFAFADAWRSLYQPSMEEVRSGRRGWTILDDLHRESLDKLLAQFGVAELFDEPARRDLNKAWRRLDPWPEVGPALSRLKQRYFIAPCSNGNIALIARMARRAALPWDAILGAEPARAYKPQPEAYLRSATMADAPPEACMMVAAHNEDLEAAAAAGLQTAFVLRATEHGPGQSKDLAPTGAWTINARDFDDLADQLNA
ncbi:MAG: haloacid dehalogenase type II [Neomegalonema sp.]|nr:haloacid dehalogenase type II [Neomegalonema sp.]